MTDSTIFVHRYLTTAERLDSSRDPRDTHHTWAVAKAARRVAKRKKQPIVVFITSGIRQQESLQYVFYKFELVKRPRE